MNKNNNLITRLILILLIVVGTSCRKDKNNNPNAQDLSPESMEINKFIWSGLHNYYLWVDSVPSLSNSNYANDNALTTFLNKYPDHENLFYSLLFKYKEVDRFSWIVDDYTSLENQFQGITKSMGYNFGLGRFSNSNNIFGYVKYVIKNSPAYNAGIRRGNLFTAVDGQDLTESNYQNLLFGKDSYTLSMAYISGNSIHPSTNKITLTATEVHENPIFCDSIYTVDNFKIGYIVYNGFMSDYDIALNNVFGYFKDNGVQKLIMDLRYNPGGSVQSAIYLASMIYGTHTDQVFINTEYNTDFGNYIKQTYGADYSLEKFTDSIYATGTSAGTLINSLNLSEVYIIATHNTASASELVINGLRPYINVVVIGDTTYGKCVGSMTIKDYDSKGVLNPNHKWALQPIVMKAANALGFTDYVDGLLPTIEKMEVLSNFSELGNQNETLLSTAINAALGISQQSGMKSAGQLEYHVVADSKDLIPHGKEMYINKLKDKSR